MHYRKNCEPLQILCWGIRIRESVTVKKKSLKKKTKEWKTEDLRAKGYYTLTPKEFFSPHSMDPCSLETLLILMEFYQILPKIESITFKAKNLLMSMVQPMRINRILRMRTFLSFPHGFKISRIGVWKHLRRKTWDEGGTY